MTSWKREAFLSLVAVFLSACTTGGPKTIGVNVLSSSLSLRQDAQVQVFLNGRRQEEKTFPARQDVTLTYQVAPGTSVCITASRTDGSEAVSLEGIVPERGQGLPVFISVSDAGGTLGMSSDFAASAPSCP